MSMTVFSICSRVKSPYVLSLQKNFITKKKKKASDVLDSYLQTLHISNLHEQAAITALIDSFAKCLYDHKSKLNARKCSVKLTKYGY